MSDPVIRPEVAADGRPVDAVLREAFGGPLEAELVAALRRDGDLVLGLIAERAGEVVGHIAFSRLAASEAPALKALALAPLAVAPREQGRGTGSTLVRAGLAMLTAAGDDLVLVLGEPAYYGRFGFRAEAATRFATPYDGPYLQALPLSGLGAAAQGPLAYAPAFAALG